MLRPLTVAAVLVALVGCRTGNSGSGVKDFGDGDQSAQPGWDPSGAQHSCTPYSGPALPCAPSSNTETAWENSCTNKGFQLISCGEYSGCYPACTGNPGPAHAPVPGWDAAGQKYSCLPYTGLALPCAAPQAGETAFEHKCTAAGFQLISCAAYSGCYPVCSGNPNGSNAGVPGWDPQGKQHSCVAYTGPALPCAAPSQQESDWEDSCANAGFNLISCASYSGCYPACSGNPTGNGQ
jgi:hypothetical protein